MVWNRHWNLNLILKSRGHQFFEQKQFLFKLEMVWNLETWTSSSVWNRKDCVCRLLSSADQNLCVASMSWRVLGTLLNLFLQSICWMSRNYDDTDDHTSVPLQRQNECSVRDWPKVGVRQSIQTKRLDKLFPPRLRKTGHRANSRTGRLLSGTCQSKRKESLNNGVLPYMRSINAKNGKSTLWTKVASLSKISLSLWGLVWTDCHFCSCG